MSSVVPPEQDVPEEVVRNRSQYAKVLHRQDSESEEAEPACPTRETKDEYTTVPRDAYLGHYKLCGNPECFGGEWR